MNQAIHDCVPRLAELPFGSLAWADQLHHTLRTIETAVEDEADAENFLELLISAYAAVFNAESPGKLGRFSSLKEHLLKDLLPTRLFLFQHLASQNANNLFQEAAQYLRSSTSPSTEAAVLQQLLPGIIGFMVSLVVQLFKDRPFDVSGLTLEEDEQVQTERSKLNAQLATLRAAQKSLDNISHTAALIPGNKFHLGTYKQAASADLLDPIDAEELLISPSLPNATLPTPDAPDAEAEYNTPNSPHSGSSSSSSQAGDSAASTAASSKANTSLPITVLADDSSDTSSSESAAPALDLSEAVAESSSAGSAAEVDAHPESVSPTSSSTSDDFVEV